MNSYAPASLDSSSLEKLRSLESDLGKVVVALERAPSVATLSQEQITRIRGLESELGLVIVAYDGSAAD